MQDPEETFVRVVGRRRTRAPGVPPSVDDRDRLATMARYRTRAPKGVFRYTTHEEANAARQRWTVEAVVGKSPTQKA